MVRGSVNRRRHRNAPAVPALICCVALLAGCGGSSSSSNESDYDYTGPALSRSIRVANCTDWKEGSVEQRRNTVIELRKFAGGPVGSSAGIQNGLVLDDGRAYTLLESYCAKRFARGFKLYKLYERAAGFVGH